MLPSLFSWYLYRSLDSDCLGVWLLPVSGYRTISRNSHNKQVLEEHQLLSRLPFLWLFLRIQVSFFLQVFLSPVPSFWLWFSPGDTAQTLSWGHPLAYTTSCLIVEGDQLNSHHRRDWYRVWRPAPTSQRSNLWEEVKSLTRKTKTHLNSRRQTVFMLEMDSNIKQIFWCHGVTQEKKKRSCGLGVAERSLSESDHRWDGRQGVEEMSRGF